MKTILSWILLFPFAAICADNSTNPPAPMISEPPSTPCHLTTYAEFLYWQPAVSGLPYAVLANVKPDPAAGLAFVADDESLKQVKFNYDPGFRIGVGGRIDTSWDIYAEWARFHTSAHASHSAAAPDIISMVWDMFPATIDHIKAHQELKFDQINFDFVKHISLGTRFIFHPFFGARGAFINQQLTITSSQTFNGLPGTHTSKLKNNFSGGGIGIGFEPDYAILDWLTLYGRGTYALLYGKFKLSKHTVTPTTITRDQETHQQGVVHEFDLLAGLDASWSYARFEIDAYVSYEFILWPGQTRLPHINTVFTPGNSQTTLADTYGDVSFHGLTAGVSASF